MTNNEAQTQQTVSDPTNEQIQQGMMALLCCTASELDNYSINLFDGYKDDVIRVYKAMLSAPQAQQATSAKVWTDEEILDLSCAKLGLANGIGGFKEAILDFARSLLNGDTK